MKREYSFKIVIVGNVGSGKTSIIQRYTNNTFTTNYKSTIGVDFASKYLELEDGSIARLQMWDIAGQERYGNLTRVYYQQAAGAIIVYDVSHHQDCVLKWKSDLLGKIPNVPVVLFANKLDLVDSIDADALNQFCTNHDFIGWSGTSAKYGKGIDSGIKHLVDYMVKHAPPADPAEDDDIITLADPIFVSEKRCCL